MNTNEPILSKLVQYCKKEVQNGPKWYKMIPNITNSLMVAFRLNRSHMVTMVLNAIMSIMAFIGELVLIKKKVSF